MKIISFLLIFLGLNCFQAISQATQSRYVLANGGNINSGSIYTSISVVGEIAVSHFSTSTVSGTTGYLTPDNNLTTNLPIIQSEERMFALYPNPSDGNFYIDLKLDEPALISIIVVNSIGQVVLEIEQTENMHIKGNGILKSGVYNVLVYGQNFSQTEKMVIR